MKDDYNLMIFFHFLPKTDKNHLFYTIFDRILTIFSKTNDKQWRNH